MLSIHGSSVASQERNGYSEADRACTWFSRSSNAQTVGQERLHGRDPTVGRAAARKRNENTAAKSAAVRKAGMWGLSKREVDGYLVMGAAVAGVQVPTDDTSATEDFVGLKLPWYHRDSELRTFPRTASASPSTAGMHVSPMLSLMWAQGLSEKRLSLLQTVTSQ